MKILNLFKKGRKLEEITNDSVIETSITLSYQADVWGTERIALDGIQNHLPADSKGTRVDIDFLVGNNWVPYASYNDGEIKAVRFSDDGKGYSSDLLGVFHSTKKDNEDAVGYFGEGLKMLSAACIREGVELELRSREWSAKPQIKDLNIDGEKIKKIVYSKGNTGKIKGSQTIFWNPSPELINYVKNLDEKVLLLRENFEPIYNNCKRSIIDKQGDLFVKGVFITPLFRDRLLFSYNLDIIPNRDRNDIHESSLIKELKEIWTHLDNTEPIKQLLKSYEENSEKFSSSHEFYTLRNYLEYLNVKTWQKAFIEMYGEKAVLGTQENIKKIVEDLGYKVIGVENNEFKKLLKNLGIKQDIDILDSDDEFLYLLESFDSSKIKRGVKSTSLTLEYRANNWGALRIVLDAVANHMPDDSGGSEVVIEYLNKKNDGNKVFYEWGKEVPYYSSPKAVRIRDNGKGFSIDNLVVLNSSKNTDDSVGQFGEGLKMLSAACLREKIPVKFRSRDWFAMPFSQSKKIDGREINILSYKTVENADFNEGSSTTFYNPDDRMQGLFKNIGDYILHFSSNVEELHKNDKNRIISQKYPKTYVKGFYVTDNNRREFQSTFSYDINTQNISPDRNNIDFKTLKKEIKALLETCDNEEVIRKILSTAKKETNKDYVEFMDLDLQDDNVKKAWKNAFIDVFGKHYVLDSKFSSWNYEAEHMGYYILHIDDRLASTLKKAGIYDARKRLCADYDYNNIPIEELNEKEKANLGLLPKLDKILGIESATIKIYDKLKDSNGCELQIPAFFSPITREIYLRRTTLNYVSELARAYSHERGHDVTGAPDPADEFRNFFEYQLLPRILKELEEEAPDLKREWLPFDYSAALKDAQSKANKLQIAADAAEKKERGLEEHYADQIKRLKKQNAEAENK